MKFKVRVSFFIASVYRSNRAFLELFESESYQRKIISLPLCSTLLIKTQRTHLIFVHSSASTFMAPYLHQFSTFLLFGTNSHCILCKSSIIIKKIYSRTESFKGSISDEFSEQHPHQSIKKRTI